MNNICKAVNADDWIDISKCSDESICKMGLGGF